MPIYAFACDACGHAFDRLQKLSDADPDTCPACTAPGQVRRRLTAPQFRLSGGGWYETDFKQDGERKRNLAGEGGEGAKPAAEPRPAEGAKPEAKPAAAPAAAPAPAAPAPAKPATGTGTPAG